MNRKRKNINKKAKSKIYSKGKRTHKEAFGSLSKEKDNYKEHIVFINQSKNNIKEYDISNIYKEMTILKDLHT